MKDSDVIRFVLRTSVGSSSNWALEETEGNVIGVSVSRLFPTDYTLCSALLLDCLPLQSHSNLVVLSYVDDNMLGFFFYFYLISDINLIQKSASG